MGVFSSFSLFNNNTHCSALSAVWASSVLASLCQKRQTLQSFLPASSLGILLFFPNFQHLLSNTAQVPKRCARTLLQWLCLCWKRHTFYIFLQASWAEILLLFAIFQHLKSTPASLGALALQHSTAVLL